MACHTHKTPGIVAQWRGEPPRPAGRGLLGVPQRQREGARGVLPRRRDRARRSSPRMRASSCHGEIVTEFPAQPSRRRGEVHRLPRQRPGRGGRGAFGGRERPLAMPWLDRRGREERRTARGEEERGRRAGARPGHLAEHRHRPRQPRRLARVLLRLPQPPCLLRAQARQPETCGKCHLGPDHPQKEIYEERSTASPSGAEGRDAPRRRKVDRRRGLLGGADLRHLPHVRHPSSR